MQLEMLEISRFDIFFRKPPFCCARVVLAMLGCGWPETSESELGLAIHIGHRKSILVMKMTISLAWEKFMVALELLMTVKVEKRPAMSLVIF